MEIKKITKYSKVEDVVKELDEGVEEIYDTEEFKEFADFTSKFWDFSTNNQLLIYAQKPDATYVTGYRSWEKKFNRKVDKGEKAIRIIAPAPFKVHRNVKTIDAEGNETVENKEVTIPSYKFISVFDVSQTTGEELPKPVGDVDVEGKVQNYQRVFKALKDISPVPIGFGKLKEGVKGCYDGRSKTITIAPKMPQLMNIEVMVHEIAHAMLHNPENGERKDKRTREVEAEAIGYIVCKACGIGDTSKRSFGYIANWKKGKGSTELKDNLVAISTTSRKIIAAIKKAQEPSKSEQPKETKSTKGVKTTQRKTTKGATTRKTRKTTKKVA